MLIANGWRAAALAGLVMGLACSPALGATPVGRFLETVKSGWAVQIGTRARDGQIVAIRIASNAQADRFVDVAVDNGLVTSTEIAKAYEWFDTENVAINPDSDRRVDLLLQAVDFDRERPGAVPDGLRLRNEPDGSTSVTDQRGSEQGRIPKGASVADKEEAVISAVAKRSADGLMSSQQRGVLPATSPVLKQTADMVREDVDIARSKSAALLGSISAKQAQEYEDAAVLLRLTNVQDKISAALASKGLLQNARMEVNSLIQACKDNQFVFEPPGQDGWFAIRDPGDDNEVIAVGQLTPNGKYVDAENLRSLTAQISDRPYLMRQIIRDTPDEMRSRSDASAKEVKSYMEVESKTDPTKDPSKEDPNPEDPNTGGTGGGNSNDDTSGPR